MAKRQLKFKLGGAEWKLRWKTHLQGEGGSQTQDRVWGETHGVDRVIFLSRKELKGKPEVAARVTFHELLHAALHMGGLDTALAAKTEESVVSCLENLLWDLISSGQFDALLDKVREAANG